VPRESLGACRVYVYECLTLMLMRSFVAQAFAFRVVSCTRSATTSQSTTSGMPALYVPRKRQGGLGATWRVDSAWFGPGTRSEQRHIWTWHEDNTPF
jgi:hypothetical protein